MFELTQQFDLIEYIFSLLLGFAIEVDLLYHVIFVLFQVSCQVSVTECTEIEEERYPWPIIFKILY